MGRTYAGSNRKIKAYLGSKKVKSMWYGSIRVYPNAGEVTYYVDNEVVYTEEIDIDQSCLTPTTFTPSKSGWTFVGWREDSTASSSVLSEKISDGNNYTLYAVFRQNVTVTKYNGSSSATTESKTRYYNNTNVVNPSFTLSQNNLSGWSALGWCDVNSPTANVVVNNGGSVTLTANKTYYGKYSQTITLSYNGNGNTGGSTASQSGTRYYNSVSYSNPSFTLRSSGFSKTNHSFYRWAQGSTSGTRYAAGASVTLSANTTFYAIWNLVPLTVNGSSVSLSRISDWGGNGNGSSGSSASVSGNKISINFWSTSYRTHNLVASAGAWNVTGFTKCTVTVSGKNTVTNYWEDVTVGLGTSRGSTNLGASAETRMPSGTWSQDITFNISSSSSAYLYVKYECSTNHNHDRDISSDLTITKIVFS